MSLLSLPDQILTQVTLNLELKDLLALGDSHTRLRDLVYKTPEIWTSDLLFPAADERITDKFIKCIVPRITRHYGILSLKMIHLPLTWTGYFMIFDQFAHSVKHILMETSLSHLRQLVHHLAVFAGNLAMLQQSNRIPITFRQYSFDHQEYANELAESHYLGQSTLHNLINQFHHMKLDDPPFERLQVFKVDVKEDQQEQQQEQQHLFRQLESLTCFLSGRTMNNAPPPPPNHSPVPTNQMLNSNNNKRQREEEDQHINSSSHKYMRHETSPHPQQQQPAYYPYQHHHHHQRHHQEQRPDQDQPQQQQQRHHHHQITRPYSTTSNYV